MTQREGHRKRIVILGGGFGGVYTARHLEELWRGAESVEIVLVSRDNYFLMTPLLFEAGSGVVEPRHAVNPIRPLFRTARFIEAEVRRIDLEGKAVHVRPTNGAEEDVIQYDHLVLALGGVTNTSMIPGAEGALTFKTLGDAIYLRNHVIRLFEQADVEKDPARKQAQMTFVVVGGGFVGVELMGELTTFVKNVSRLYKHVDERDVRFEMIEAGPRIAAEFDEELADYAAGVLQRRGVKIRTNTKVAKMEPGKVYLPHGEVIGSETVLVATGVSPSPIVAALPIEKDKRGRAITEPTMRCKDRQELWALGDCASIPDPNGKPYPPLAQHALREAKQLAENITAVLRGGQPQPFVYQNKGSLAALGHFKGAGRVYRFKIHGFLAWWVWRTYYLFQMPQWSRRLRLILDWTIALFFKNDVVQLDLSREVRLKEQTERRS
jgi:NADH dehydrogenase